MGLNNRNRDRILNHAMTRVHFEDLVTAEAKTHAALLEALTDHVNSIPYMDMCALRRYGLTQHARTFDFGISVEVPAKNGNPRTYFPTFCICPRDFTVVRDRNHYGCHHDDQHCDKDAPTLEVPSLSGYGREAKLKVSEEVFKPLLQAHNDAARAHNKARAAARRDLQSVIYGSKNITELRKKWPGVDEVLETMGLGPKAKEQDAKETAARVQNIPMRKTP